MSVLREYNWRDWIDVPKNKELYNSDMKEGLRQFQLEKNRRDKLTQIAVFNQKGFQ
jgi:hypothetical protein